MSKYNQTRDRVKNRIKVTDKQFDTLYTKLPDSAKRKLNSDDIADLVTYTYKIKETTKKITFKRAMKVSGRNDNEKPKTRKRRTKKELANSQ